MYELSRLEAVAPEALPRNEGVEVFEHGDDLRYGIPQVTLLAASPDALLMYVLNHWEGLSEEEVMSRLETLEKDG